MNIISFLSQKNRTGLTRCLLLMGLFALAPVAVQAEPLAADVLAKKPEFTSMQISPDGASVAYMRINDEDLISLEILDLKTNTKQGVSGTKNFDVGGFSWLDDRRLAVTLSKDKLYGVGLYIYDRKTGRLGALKEGGIGIVGVPQNRKNRLIVRTGGDESVILEYSTLSDSKNAGFGSNHDPVRRSYPPLPKGRLRGYFTDVVGEPALGVVYLEAKERAFLLNQKEETWRLLDMDLEETPLLAIAEDRQLAWICRYTDDGGSAIHTYDLIDQTFGPSVYEDPNYDLSGASLVLSEDGRELQGISYMQVRAHSVWFDKKLQAAFDRLSQALEGFDIRLVDRSRDQNKAIFIAVSSTEPGQFFLADLESGGIQHVAASAPWLAGVALNPAASFNFEARDGLELQAYLTMPATAGGKKPYPLMVLGHGGPWARDVWRFDPEVQFLASRGYAVLQVNYRGSTGFNRKISNDDRFEFRKMHDDVTDGVKTLIRGGIVDEDRVGIMGASFGGYLAIAGAAWEPDLYRCAITNVGVFDWDMLISDSRRESYTSYYWLLNNFGNDAQKVADFSPLNQVDDIKIPIFIAHGRQDIRVDISQSINLERALKARDIPYETYYEGDSAHGFAAAEAQTAYLNELDQFLARYFPTGRAVVNVGEAKVSD